MLSDLLNWFKRVILDCQLKSLLKIYLETVIVGFRQDLLSNVYNVKRGVDFFDDAQCIGI